MGDFITILELENNMLSNEKSDHNHSYGSLK